MVCRTITSRSGRSIDNPHHRIAYRPPANVTLQPIPLWGLELAEEYLPRRDGWRRAWRTSPPVVRHRFLPSWEHLVDCLAAPEASRGLSATACRRSPISRSASTCAALGERRHPGRCCSSGSDEHHPPHVRGSPPDGFARTLYRYLLPLTAPTPVCDVAHSSAAALCALPAIVAKYRYGTPLVLTEHGIYLRERSGPVGGALRDQGALRQLLPGRRRARLPGSRRAHAGVRYNAEWEEVLGVDPDRIRVIYNGVDPAASTSGRSPKGRRRSVSSAASTR